MKRFVLQLDISKWYAMFIKILPHFILEEGPLVAQKLLGEKSQIP